MYDIFDTRTMIAALEERFPPKTFLLDKFFSHTEVFTTAEVDIDVMKGKRRIASFVNPTKEGKVSERTGFTAKTFRPAYLKEKMSTTAADILKRPMGNTIYSGGMSPAERAAMQVGKDLGELQDMFVRREEVMAAEALRAGVVTVVGEGVNATVDFQMAADHIITLAGNDLWTDVANSDPLQDLRVWRTKAAQDSGLRPDAAVFGSDVVKAFLAHDDVKEILNNRRVAIGEIVMKELADMGATYIGNIEGLEIFQYDEWYWDGAADQPMVPVDRILLGSTSARTSRNYGAIQDLKSTAAVPFFAKSWEEEDPSVRWLLLQSAPLVTPHQIDAFISVKAV